MRRLAQLLGAAAVLGMTPAAVVAEVAGAGAEAPGLSEALSACQADKWDDGAFAEQGFVHGAHYSLVAKGQRVQQYDRNDGRPGISLHSSFIEYVACSTGVDLAAPEEFAPARDVLVAKMGLTPVALAGQSVSPNAKAFMAEYDLATAGDIFSSGRQLLIFKFRQFSGRNRMAVYVIRPN